MFKICDSSLVLDLLAGKCMAWNFVTRVIQLPNATSLYKKNYNKINKHSNGVKIRLNVPCPHVAAMERVRGGRWGP